METIRTNEYQGIGGWLIVVACGLCISVYKSFTAVMANVSFYSTNDIGELSSINKILTGLIHYETAISIVQFLVCIALVILFFLKHHFFVKAYTILLSILLVLNFINALIASQLSELSEQVPTYWGRIIAQFLSIVIWTLYLLRSKRVKQTFIH